MELRVTFLGPIHKTAKDVYQEMKLLVFFFGLIFTVVNSTLPGVKNRDEKTVRYIALGDSYTICEGADKKSSWPVILTQHLNEAGIKTELVANPSRTGFTTQDLIDKELPVFDGSKAGFVTLCIGVNDWVQGINAKVFEKNLVKILDHVQDRLNDRSKILLLTIPDFSVTPQGGLYTGGRNASEGIAAFNQVILKQAEKRNLQTVDLFEVSKKMGNDGSLVANDGLHPSAKEYAIWETLIFPVAHNMLK